MKKVKIRLKTNGFEKNLKGARMSKWQRMSRSILMLFVVMLFVAGCGYDNSESVQGAGETPTIPNIIDGEEDQLVALTLVGGNSRTLSLNNEVVTINVRAYDGAFNPYSGGNVKISFPSKVSSGIDVGSFAALEVPLVNGEATFVYTGPDQLQELVNSGDVRTTFAFYSDESPEISQEFTVNYEPEQNQVVLTNYKLQSSFGDNNVTMGLDSDKLANFSVVDAGGNEVADSDMISMTVTLLNAPLADLSDTFGNSGDTLTFTANNSNTVNISSTTRSGVVPVKVQASFVDINGDTQTLEEVYNVVVFSGPPSAISISYASTDLNATFAKFEENLVITVTDQYFNPVNTNPAFSVGLLAGYATSSVANGNPHNYLYYEPNTATIPSLVTATVDPFNQTLTASSPVFGNVDVNNDKMISFGTGYVYDSSGKWDFIPVSDSVMEIVDDVNSSIVRSNLGFAIGNNQREDTCEIGTKWVGNIEDPTGDNRLNSQGLARVKLAYDYYLAGKDVVVWVNVVGLQADTKTNTKIGEARKITLRGRGLVGPDGYNYAAGQAATLVTFFIDLAEVNEPYRNGRFIASLESTGDAIVSFDSSSNIEDCTVRDGQGFVTVLVDASGATEDGVVTLEDIEIVSEF